MFMFRSFHATLGCGARKKSLRKLNRGWSDSRLKVEALEDRAVPATLLGWDTSMLTGGAGNYGPSPFAATTTDPGVTGVIGLTRGTGIATGGTAAARAWGGTDWQNPDAAVAVTDGDTIAFGFTVAGSSVASLSSIDLSYRRSGTGAQSGQWAYQVDNGNFTDIGTSISFDTATSNGATLPPLDLAGIAALQNLAAGTTVSFRLSPYGGTGSVGTFYVFDVANSTANDLVLNGTISPAAPSAPLVTSPTATSIASTTATLGGNVITDGGAVISERGIVYAETSVNNNPQIGDTGVTVVTAIGATGDFTIDVANLIPATGYSYAAYATNSVGTSYTSVDTFTTTAATNTTTTTTMDGNPASPQPVGTSVAFTALVTGNPSVGDITFYAGPGLTNQIGSPVNVVNGSATSAATTTLPVGSNTISAVYSGGTGFAGSTGTTTYDITSAPPMPTTTVVTANPIGAQPYGTQVTFIATVNSVTTPAGDVDFSDNGNLLGSATLSNGVAMFTPSAPLTVGLHTITASYLGNTTHAASSGTYAQTINYAAGDLIVTRVGTGTGALSPSATATFLENYSPTGTAQPANTIALPTASGAAFTLGGTAATEGYLSLAADGHSLSIAGYNQVPGSATGSANRVVGVVSPSGGVDLSTQMPPATGGARATASADGLGFWVASTSGLRYVPLGNSAAAASTQVTSFFSTVNGVAISPSGRLYLDAGAGAQTGTGIPAIDGPAAVGAGLPINAGQAASILIGFPTAANGGVFPAPNQFAISPDGNTIFLADSRTTATGGLLQFYQAIPGQWSNVLGNVGFPIGAPGADSGLRALSVDFSDPANPVVYATTTSASANRIVKITGGTTDGTTPTFVATTLATAPANEAFRGVALAPQAAGTNASNTTLTVSADSGDYGTGVTLTARVNQGADGWVSFQVNGVEIGAAPILPGPSQFDMATLVTAGNLGAGPFDVVAVYTGNEFFAPSTSAPQTVKINKAATSTDLAVSTNAVAAGSPVTLTATITVPAGTSSSGTVTFFDGNTALNATPANVAQLITGGAIKFQATFAAAFTTTGGHSVTAVYSGDDNFLTSTSEDATISVVSPTTTTVTTSDANPAGAGATVTLTATVAGSVGIPSGTVEFFDNLLPLGGPITLANGVATTTVSTALLQTPDKLTPGLHSISAIFTPDAASEATYGGSTGVYQQAVQAQPFGANNQFIYRVGDGITPPTIGTVAVGSTIYVDEYTPNGALVQSLILPSADGTGQQSDIHAIVGSGLNSNVGQLSLSGDGRYLFIEGYNAKPLDAPAIVSVTANSVPRAVARIKFDGTIQTQAFAAGAGGVGTGGGFVGVYSPDGNQFYVSGFNGVYYFSSFTPSAVLVPATATITATTFTVTGLGNNGGNLFAVGGPTGAGASSNLIQQYNGFPTAAATLNPLPGVNNVTDPGQTLFTIDAYFTHLEGPGAPAGINTFYLSDDGPNFTRGKISKWSLVDGTWILNDTIAAGTGNSALTFYWLSGITDASGNVSLYSTYGNGGGGNTGGGHLYLISDSNGYNAPIGAGGTHSDALNVVVSLPAASYENFRGVASVPKIAATATALVATPNASTGGQLVTFTATVAPSPGAAGTVTFKDNGTTIPGGENVALIGGVATFQISTLSDGTHPITAEYSGDAAAGFAASTSNTLSFVVSPAATPPQVVSVAPNGNILEMAGVQRSRIASLVVTFDGPVQLDADAMALALHTNTVVFNGDPQPAGFGTLPDSLSVSSTDNINWTVTFAGNTDNGADGFNSLRDGVYDLAIDAAKVHPLGVPGVNMAGNYTNTFHRLFGDINPPAQIENEFSAVVNTGDNLTFRGAFNNAATYKAFLDFNGDGVINTGDNLQFRNRFNRTLSWTV
jgi:hypothetical protein